MNTFVKIVKATHVDRLIPDDVFLKTKFYLKMGYRLNLNDPKTYNEKLNWLKMYDRRPIYTYMADESKAKEYVRGIIGDEYIIPTLQVWNTPDEINLDSLPEKYVIKCNHDSGSVFLCTDKKKFNLDNVKKKLRRILKTNYFWFGREWPYKNIERKIFAEKFMVDESCYELKDFKFFCFDGEPKFMFVAKDRHKEGEETKFDFFDMDFNHLPVKNGHPNSNPPYNKPDAFEKMKEIASKLSQGIPQVRVDLYDINGKIYFGEMTFFHWSGLVPFEPAEWDKKFGDYIKLPKPTA